MREGEREGEEGDSETEAASERQKVDEVAREESS